MWCKGELSDGVKQRKWGWLILNEFWVDWPGAHSCTNVNSAYQDLKGDTEHKQ